MNSTHLDVTFHFRLISKIIIEINTFRSIHPHAISIDIGRVTKCKQNKTKIYSTYNTYVIHIIRFHTLEQSSLF